MRKYFTTYKFKKRNSINAINSLNRQIRHKIWRKKRNGILNQFSDYSRKEFLQTGKISNPFHGHEQIVAPSNLSMRKNHHQLIHFIDTIKTYFDDKKNVYLDLSNVNKIDYDGILVLLSIMIRFKAEKIDFSGCVPKDQYSKYILEKSMFFYYMTRKMEDIDSYSVRNNKGDINTVANRFVQSQLSAEIIKEASKVIWGEERRCPSIQRVFIELMHNTVDHAVLGDNVPSNMRKHWWCTVNYNKINKIVSFSFVDYGVGIFESLNSKKQGSKWFNWRRILTLSRDNDYANNTELFRDMLNGVVHKTVTGEEFRGKGLPGIMESYKRNDIKKLCIITNDVFFDADTDTYSKIKHKFNGTYVYWEMDNSVSSFK